MRGADVFDATCAGCHGEAGLGGDPGPRLVGSGLDAAAGDGRGRAGARGHAPRARVGRRTEATCRLRRRVDLPPRDDVGSATIVDVDARIVRLQLAETFVIAREATDYADVVHVAVTHEGITGYGEAAPVERYDESTRSAMRFVDEHGVARRGRSRSRSRTSESGSSRVPGEQATKSALDAALHDLQGKLLGVPAARLLGLPRAGPPTSWTVWLGDPDDMARRAEKAASSIYRRLKLKLGGGDGLDVERVSAVRSATELPLRWT